MGRPRKPAAQHQAEGTYRADRHAEVVVGGDTGALSVVPSEHVPATVHAEYTMTMRRLVDIGIIIDADVPLLEAAFVLLADARYYHSKMEMIKKTLDELENKQPSNMEDMVKVAIAQANSAKMLMSLNSMHIKATTLYSSIISRFAITPSERAKILHALPKKKTDPEKKSIKSVIARKP